MIKIRSVQSIITTILLVLLGVFAGYYFGVRGFEIKVKEGLSKIEVENKGTVNVENVDFSRFWEVWDIINNKHIRKPFDKNKLVEGAINGMIESIDDPYTSYFNPVENSEAMESLNGLYEGIGAQLGYDEGGGLIVVSPLDGSPAQNAGVLAGDRILAISGEETVGITIEQAVNKIRGNAGTSIVLTLARNIKPEPFDVSITRGTIKLDSVIWEDKGDGIAYIRLSRFGGETNKDWLKVVSEIKAEMPNLDGIILDVRNNPGGYLDSAVYISSEFIKNGVVVNEEFSDGSKQRYEVDHNGVLTDNDLKIVVLINGGSASASEIVAGALKERRQALLVGARSFGKGTVQKSEEFTDGSSVHVTIAKWLTPNGNWIDKHNSTFKDSLHNELDESGNEIVGGLKPEFEVIFSDQDIEEGKDVQLDKAIEVIKSEEFSKNSALMDLYEKVKVLF